MDRRKLREAGGQRLEDVPVALRLPARRHGRRQRMDEGVQIHGGNGFSAEYNISRAYRDSRINRIYEGTNEINRLLTLDMTLKRAMQGRLDLMGPAMAVQKELMSIPDFGEQDDAPFASEKKLVNNLKKAILVVSGAAVQKLMAKVEHEQEVLMNIADMSIDTYLAESTLLRVQQMIDTMGEDACKEQIAMAKTLFIDTADRINKAGKDAINSFAEGDELRVMLMVLKRFTKTDPYNVKDARQLIAQKIIDKNEYCF